MALAGLLAGPLGAQSRSSLQVAAQVISAGPSQEALRQVQPMLGKKGLQSNTALANISVGKLTLGSTADPVARRPRTVVTISFLSN